MHLPWTAQHAAGAESLEGLCLAPAAAAVPAALCWRSCAFRHQSLDSGTELHLDQSRHLGAEPTPHHIGFRSACKSALVVQWKHQGT